MFLRRLDRDAAAGATRVWQQHELTEASWVKRKMYSFLPIGPKSMLAFWALGIYAWWMGFKESVEGYTKYLNYLLGLAFLA